MNKEEITYKILRDLSSSPDVSQRDIAVRLGVSLGRVNYCLQALVRKGLVKVRNFRNNKNKLYYAYLLTPGGMEEKARLTVEFLHAKIKEHQRLESEIVSLQKEVSLLSGIDVIATVDEEGLLGE